MHTLPFAEYRCTCGRLLFKGLVLSGHVEVKCKRCSEIVLFDQPDTKPYGSPYSILVDSKGYIKDASVSAPAAFGYSREALCAMTIHDIPQGDSASPEIMRITTPEPLEVYFYRSAGEIPQES